LLQISSLLPVRESFTWTCCVGPKNLPCAKVARMKILAKLVGNGNRAENRGQEWILFLVMAIGMASTSHNYCAAERARQLGMMGRI
jgi:hypothetical protein